MKNAQLGILDKLHLGHRRSENGGTSRSGFAPFHDDEYVHLIAANARDLIIHAQITPESKFDYVSPSSTRITGYTPEEFYTDPRLTRKLTHPDDIHLILEAMQPGARVSANPLEIRWIRKDGVTIWTEHMITYNRDKAGALVSCQIIARDITERKKTELALLETQNFNASLMNNAPHATVVINPDTSIKYVNPAWEKLNGWTLAEVAGMKSPYPWWPSEFSASFAAGFKEAMSLPAGKGEVIAQKKSGELYWIDMNWAAVTNNGKIVYTLINSIDITERKRMETAIQESEEKFSKAFASSPNAICIVSLEKNHFIEVNDSFTRFTGYSREEAVGHDANDLHLWTTNEEARRITDLMQKNSRLNNEQFQSRMKSGEIRTGLMSMEMIDIGGHKCMMLVITDITEQIHARKALTESEEKFSRAFRSSPDIMAITTMKDGRYLEVNESFTRGTGYAREEVIGRTVSDINTWANQHDRARMLRLLKENGRVYNEEFQFLVKSGDVHTMLFSVEKIKIGNEACLISVCNDITERKRMEQALRESEEKFSTAFHSSPDMMAIINLKNGRFVEVNDCYAKTLEYTRQELVGHRVEDFNIWVNTSETENMLRLMADNGKIRHEEFHFRTKSGKMCIWLGSVDTINIGGDPCMLCVATDITERKQAQQAQRESEEKFAAAFHSSPDMIIISDFTGEYIDVNDSFVQNTGYSREELVGHNISEIDMWVDPAEVEKFTQALQKQGKVKNEVYRFRRKTGEIRTWLCSAEIISIGGETRMLAVATDITERKQAEEALKESEEKFSKAFNASPFSISISRLGDGKFIEVNESFLRDKGYTREELIGRSSKEFNIWANHDEAKDMMEIIKGHGQVRNKQLQYRTKSGHVRTGLVSAEVINISNEPCMLVMNSDITQQKLAEEQLRLLSSVTEQVSDSTIITDPHLRVTYINQAARDLFGYTIEEVRGKPLSFFDEKHLPDDILIDIREKLSKSKLWRGVNTKRHKNGNSIICDCRITPLYDEKGQISSFIDVQRDVTRQKEVEAKLQEHKKLIDSILATMPEGVLVIDSKDRIVLANKAFGDIFHIQKTTLKNKSLIDVLPDDRFLDLHKAVQSKATDNTTLEFRYQAHGMDKIIYCIIVKMDGERKLITFSDISKERDEEEKLYLTDRLASLGEMAAGLAHELNNPLTGILALSQMLVGSDLPEEHKEDLECIYSEAKRAAGIVKNVLLFARNKTDASGRTTVNDVVTDVLRLREYEQKVGNIKVLTELEGNLPEIPIDKGQLQQVFLNLISNAEAAIREVNRPGIITVSTQRTNNHINILFSDNGCGIKKQIMPRIFDPFFTTKDIGKGTGLGLSICYSIIVKHGGKISVKSQVNEGTTFTIRMPVVFPER
jgi:PAS domain S-box-containing protein